MHYVYLAIAIILELVGTSFMKASDGFTKTIPTIICIVSYIVCFYCFSIALKSIHLGVAYAIWGGLGIALTAVLSVLIFNQKLDWPAIVGICFIITGVVIMNVFSKTSSH